MVKLVLGLVAGLIAGFLIGYYLPDQKPDPWINAGLRWETLPDHRPAAALPQTFSIPSQAYAYGAASPPLGGLLRGQPSILRIEAAATAGQVGVLLTSPDGAQVLSKEKVLTPAQGKAEIYFVVRPETPPAIVVFRNFDAQGQAGSVTVSRATYAASTALPNDELDAINASGVQ